MELYEVFLMSTQNPTLMEMIARALFPYGTHALRPTASDVPVNSFYFETDTTNLYQSQEAAWVQVASLGGGGSSGTLGGAKATATGNQAIANATATKIALDNELYDTDNYHDNTTNNSRMTVPATGVYLITALLNWAGNAGPDFCWLLVNNTTTIAFSDLNSAYTVSVCTLCTIAALTAGDYVELVAYQGTGGSVNTTQQAAYAPMLAIERLR